MLTQTYSLLQVDVITGSSVGPQSVDYVDSVFGTDGREEVSGRIVVLGSVWKDRCSRKCRSVLCKYPYVVFPY